MDDCQLLQDYTERGSETAFRTLVNRYLSLVHSAALRQVNDPHLAEEVSQAVFILLAQKAGSFRQSVVLAGWLFRTTRFVATRALRSEQRRQRREQEAFDMQQLTTPDDAWRRLAPVLDEALARLGETDRNAVLLRFLQDKKHREVGNALGLNEAAAKKRVARALEKLRAFFVRRGFTLSATALTSALAANASKAAPTNLSNSVVAAAIAGGTATTSALPAIVNETLTAWRWTKVKLAAEFGAGLLFAVLLGPVAWRTLHSAFPSDATKAVLEVVTAGDQQNTPAPAESNPAIKKQIKSQTANLRLLVVGANDGHALAGARVIVNYWHGDATRIDLSTEADGVCEVPFSGQTFDTLRVWVSAAGHVPKVISWHDYELGSQTEEYVIRLDRGRTVRGIVRDESGSAIANVKLLAQGPGLDSAQREKVGYHRDVGFVTSDDQGRWSFGEAPQETKEITFFVTHPEFARLRASVLLTEPETTNAVLTLNGGVTLSGVVVTPNGVPIGDASVDEIDSYRGPELHAWTDVDGSFLFGHVNPGPLKLQVEAVGYTKLTKTVEASTNLDENRFVLGEANSPEGPSRAVPTKTIHLTGRVVDAETGQPLPRFQVILDERRGTLPEFIGDGTDGTFDWIYPCRLFNEYTLEVQADGYMPEASPATKVNESEQQFEFKLKKHSGIAGRVLLPDGQPAASAEVFLGGKNFGPAMVTNPTRGAFLRPNTGNDDRDKQTKTDVEGKFWFKPARLANRVVVSHELGCAAVSLNDLAAGPIVLQRWGRIEGALRIGNRAGANQTVGTYNELSPPDKPWVPYNHNTKTDGTGRFTFERVPPGDCQVFRVTDFHEGLAGVTGLSHYKTIHIKAGDDAKVTIGGEGRTVIGRIHTLPEGAVSDWTRDLQKLVRRQPGLSAPKQESYPDNDALLRAWRQFDAAEAKYYLVISRDGSFVADDVPPGSYQLEIRVTAPPTDPLSEERFMPNGKEIGSLNLDVMIPEAPAEPGADPFDLGTVNLELKTNLGSPK